MEILFRDCRRKNNCIRIETQSVNTIQTFSRIKEEVLFIIQCDDFISADKQMPVTFFQRSYQRILLTYFYSMQKSSLKRLIHQFLRDQVQGKSGICRTYPGLDTAIPRSMVPLNRQCLILLTGSKDALFRNSQYRVYMIRR